MQKLFLTFFGLGLLPKAPGTFGSIGGWIVGIFLLYFFSSQTLFLLGILLYFLAVEQIDKYEIKTGLKDHQIIVIDEVLGVWLAMIFVPENYIAQFLALIFFRVFDITKPSIIGRLDRNLKGGFGVVVDDLAAGFFAGILSNFIFYILLRFTNLDFLNFM